MQHPRPLATTPQGPEVEKIKKQRNYGGEGKLYISYTISLIFVISIIKEDHVTLVGYYLT